MKNKNTALGIVVIAISCSIAIIPVLAAGTSSLEGQVNTLEHRFFFHQYVHDPLEKRLQRLELLVFGDTQAGSNDERLAKLQRTIAQRDRDSAEHTRAAAQAQPTVQPKNQPASPSAAKPGEYPAVSSLEWRALKKTYPQDALDNRLERLEIKLFGQSSPAMSYADRVERLNRTLGIGIASENKAPGFRMGPMPKASPRSQEYDFRGQFAVPGQAPFNDDLSQTMNQMIRQMDQQMEQLMRTPFAHIPNEPFDQEDAPPYKKSQPFVFPKSKSAPSVVPPYNDPNSI